MADVTIAPHLEVVNTRGIDLIGGGTAVTTGQTVAFSGVEPTDRLLLILEETGSSTASVVFDAGDDPPSLNKAKGSLTIALAANDLRPLFLEGGRFTQDDGTITCTLTGTAKMYAMRIPLTV